MNPIIWENWDKSSEVYVDRAWDPIEIDGKKLDNPYAQLVQDLLEMRT